MANDGSIMAQVEAFIAATLAALTKPDESKVFKTAEPWKYQIDPARGGVAAFVKYAPFTFAAFLPPGSSRQGDYDLEEELRFAVVLGTVSDKDGVARLGDSSDYGIGKLYDLTVKALDKKHPGVTDCGDIYFVPGTDTVLETPKSYCLQLYFKCSLIRTG